MMTTPSETRALSRSQRVTFQVQTRAEIGPFRNYGEPHVWWPRIFALAEDAQKFSEGVRIIAFLNEGFYAIVWVDGIYQGSPGLHDPVVAQAMHLRCEHCAQRVVMDSLGTLVDESGGDVCGWGGGNEPHDINADPWADRCRTEDPCPVRATQGGLSCDHV